MSEGALINPDAQFIREIMSSGGKDLKKCMQCGTCSVVCELTLQDCTFPRKQMFEAQWGLKEKLFGDPAIWLCHNCGDCSSRCPRKAQPGDVLGALRKAAIEHFAWPGFAGKTVLRAGAFPLLLVIPALLVWAVALQGSGVPEGAKAEFAHRFPIPALELLFFAVSGFAALAFSVGLIRFLKALKASGASAIGWAGLSAALIGILTHERFSKCGENRSRRWGHLLTFWGFTGLAFMGTVVGIGSMTHLMHTPLDPLNPLKVFANLAAVAAVAGCILLLVNRVRDPITRRASTYFDWFLLLTLSGVVLTGFLSEILRLMQAGGVMYGIYSIHLILILLLILYAPYSKFSHLMYRTFAVAAMWQPGIQKEALTDPKVVTAPIGGFKP